jgi:hypothetical protein
MIYRRSRLRRVLKWGGVASCLLIVGLFVFSTNWLVWWSWRNGHVYLNTGRVGVSYWGLLPESEQEEMRGIYSFTSGLQVLVRGSPFGLRWLRSPYLHRMGAGVPLWLAFITFVIPTAILWHRDRHPPPGHCQTCGYNLTGNTSGRCPECGEAV